MKKAKVLTMLAIIFTCMSIGICSYCADGDITTPYGSYRPPIHANR